MKSLKKYQYSFPHPALTVDIILIVENLKCIELLLIKRRDNPFKNQWALPGGFVDEQEPLKIAAKRELFEETSIKNVELEQFMTYGNSHRDPRGWTVSVVFWSKIATKINAKPSDDAIESEWFDIQHLPNLAFDHKQIIKDFYYKFFK